MQIISYFMGGLYYSAGAFFSFYLIVLSGFFALAGFFRLLGTLCKTYDHAARFASIIITFMFVRWPFSVLTLVRPTLT